MMRRLYIGAVRVSRVVVGTLFDLDRKPRGRAALWLRSLLSIYDSADLVRLEVPWWTFSAADYVERFIKSRRGQVRVLEYGSGASTIWLARRCAEVVTVEHDPEFFSAMAPLFESHGNVRAELVPPELTIDTTSARSRREGYENRSFDNYVNVVDRHEGDFDLIVIDGRSRVSCLNKAMGRLAKGGIVVFDNSNRREYRNAIVRVALTERIMRGMAPALPYPSQTSILSSE